ncbi:MAG: MlaD family protein [Syntrophobacteraceae bacterium]
MARHISPFKLGLFVLVCGALGLTAVIWLGMSHFFEETKTYVSYFDESVKGLQKDAVINYRGVAVGRVAEIRLAPDGRLIEVLLYLRPDFQVDSSLAIQLREQGLTGLRYLEIDTAPKDIADLSPELSFKPPYPLIASNPSEIIQLKAALESMYQKVKDLDLRGLTASWTQTAERINELLAKVKDATEGVDWRETVVSLNKASKDLATLFENLRVASAHAGLTEGVEDLSATFRAARQASEALAKQIKELPPQTLAGMAKGVDKTVASGEKLILEVDRQVAQSSLLLQENLQMMRQLITQMTQLVQTLKDQPNRLVFPPSTASPFDKK